MADSNYSVDVIINAVDKGTAVIKGVGDAVGQTSEQIKGFGDAVTAVGDDVVGIADKAVNVFQKVKGFSLDVVNTMTLVDRSLNSFGDTIVNIGRGVTSFGTNLTSALIDTGIDGFVKGVESKIQAVQSKVMSFSSTIRSIGDPAAQAKEKMDGLAKSLTGVETGDMDRVAFTVKEIGATSKFSADQATEAFKSFSTAGYTVRQSFETMQVAIDLATYSGKGLAETVTTLTGLVKQFGMTSGDAEYVGDLLVKTADAIRRPVDAVTSALKDMGDTAKESGMSINESAAIMEVLQKHGVDVAKSASGINDIFKALSDPSDELTAALSGLDVEIVKTDSGSVNLIQTLSQMGATGASEAFATLGSKAKDVASALAGNIEEIKQTAIANIDFDQSLRQMAGTIEVDFSSAVRSAEDSFTGLREAVGKPLLGAFTTMLQWITKIINSIREWVDAHPLLTQALFYVGLAIGVLTTAFGLLIIVIGHVVKHFMMMQLMQIALKLATEQFGITAQSAGQMVGGLAGQLVNFVKGAGGATSSALGFSTALNMVGTAASKVGGAMSGVVSAVSGAAQGINAALVSATSGTGMLSGAVSKLATSAIPSVLGAVALIGPLFKEHLGQAAAQMDTTALSIAGMGAMFGPWGFAIGGITAGVYTLGKAAWDLWKDWTKGTETAKQSTVNVNDELKQTVAQYVMSSQSLDEAQEKHLADLRKSGVEMTKEERDKIKDLTRVAWEHLSSFKEAVKGVAEATGESESDIMSKEKTVIEQLKDQIKEFGGPLENFSGSAKDAEQAMKKWGDESKKSADTIKKELQKTKEAMADMSRESSERLSSLKEAWDDTAKFTQDHSFGAKTRAMLSGAGGYLSGLKSEIENTAKAWGEKLGDIKNKLADAMGSGKSVEDLKVLGEGFKSMSEAGIQQMEKLRDAAKQALGQMKTELQNVQNEILRVQKEANEARYQDTKRAEDAITGILRKSMTDAQKYEDIKAGIQRKLAEARNLEAAGDEESFKRAQELRRSAISDAQQLTKVTEKLKDAQGKPVTDPRTGKQAEKTIISEKQAAEDAISAIREAQTDLNAATTAQEQQKTSVLEQQKAEIQSNISMLEQMKNTADQVVKTLRSEMKVQVDTAEAETQLREVAKDRTVTFIAQVKNLEEVNKQLDKTGSKQSAAEATPPVGAATGGQLSGYGGGDTVPAMLEPGEFVMRKEAVKSYGSNFMHAINQLKARVSGFMSGGLVGFMPQLAFAGGGPVDRVIKYGVNVELGLTSAADRLLDKMDKVADKYNDMAKSTQSSIGGFDFGRGQDVQADIRREVSKANRINRDFEESQYRERNPDRFTSERMGTFGFGKDDEGGLDRYLDDSLNRRLGPAGSPGAGPIDPTSRAQALVPGQQGSTSTSVQPTLQSPSTAAQRDRFTAEQVRNAEGNTVNFDRSLGDKKAAYLDAMGEDLRDSARNLKTSRERSLDGSGAYFDDRNQWLKDVYRKEKEIDDDIYRERNPDRFTSERIGTFAFGKEDEGDLDRTLDESLNRRLGPAGSPGAGPPESAQQSPVNITVNVNKDGKAAFSTGGNYNAWG